MTTMIEKAKALIILRKYGPLQRSDFTRKLWHSCDHISGARMRKLLNTLLEDDYIRGAKPIVTMRPGPKPEYFDITRTGRQWLNDQTKADRRLTNGKK